MMQVAAKYDHEIFMPLMLVVYNILTPTFVNVKFAMSIMLEIGVFGALASTEKDTLKFFRIELSFFQNSTMLANAFNPLIWWAKHEQYFPNISCFAQQFMGIVSSQN